VRGELSGLKLASSGHLYGDIKDADAAVNIVCWKTSLSRLGLRPEDGMDVVATGRMSSYPKSSRYQLVIESMALAGEGALLKMLEDRRKRLANEGLFDAGRKKPIPFLPSIIGVVTSPTGAVIRDILHRITDRFPVRVIVWPVPVQGAGAGDQVAAAIRGFNAMENPPDVLIVARGGGSLEDLMAFNEESVVRAAAESRIPLISAIGHETDTTLIDFAADIRAPTPTGAAEMAVPRRDSLAAQTHDLQGRLHAALSRVLQERRIAVDTAAHRLGAGTRILEGRAQALDTLSERLPRALQSGVQARALRLAKTASSLPHPGRQVEGAARLLTLHGGALARAGSTLLKDRQNAVFAAARMLESLSFQRVLDRGFAVVRALDGTVITGTRQVKDGMDAEIAFGGGEKCRATLKTALKK